MAERPLRILQVNAADVGGGAYNISWNLFQTYRRLGHRSWLAVSDKIRHDADVLLIPKNDCKGRWARIWVAVGDALYRLVSLAPRTESLRDRTYRIRGIGQPNRWVGIQVGHEDFGFPGTSQILDLPPEPPDVLHCHNLYGYFDLRALPWLSQQLPVVLTLHDAWLLGGHCAHSFDCERWKTGCGHCPNLDIYPSILRDATAFNWRRKRKIYAGSRFYVATPSRWLMQKVEESILTPAIVEARVIPNGVDLSVFHLADRQEARSVLGLPQDARILLSVGNFVRTSVWRDYHTMQAAVDLVGKGRRGEGLLFIALGEDAPTERIGSAEIRFVPFQKDLSIVARYYQAADVYVHAARADTFPNTVLEALACGTPVVATTVGGIPEQIDDGTTGFLVPPGDAKAMAARIRVLLDDDELRKKMGVHGAESARERFDVDKQAMEYLKWFSEIVSQRYVSERSCGD